MAASTRKAPKKELGPLAETLTRENSTVDSANPQPQDMLNVPAREGYPPWGLGITYFSSITAGWEIDAFKQTLVKAMVIGLSLGVPASLSLICAYTW